MTVERYFVISHARPDGGGHDDAAGAKLHHLSLAEVAQVMAQTDYR